MKKLIVLFLLIIFLLPVVSATSSINVLNVAALGGSLIIFISLIILFAFWLWMLLDCVKRDFDDKLVWIIIIALLGILGANIYYFAKRKKLKKESTLENQKLSREQYIQKYISFYGSKGQTPQQIGNNLLQKGFSREEIMQAFNLNKN